MSRELEFQGILFPSLLVIFVVAALVCWGLDAVLARAGVYRQIWHASLFRVCLFVSLFGILGLIVYE